MSTGIGRREYASRPGRLLHLPAPTGLALTGTDRPPPPEARKALVWKRSSLGNANSTPDILTLKCPGGSRYQPDATASAPWHWGTATRPLHRHFLAPHSCADWANAHRTVDHAVNRGSRGPFVGPLRGETNRPWWSRGWVGIGGISETGVSGLAGTGCYAVWSGPIADWTRGASGMCSLCGECCPARAGPFRGCRPGRGDGPASLLECLNNTTTKFLI